MKIAYGTPSFCCDQDAFRHSHNPLRTEYVYMFVLAAYSQSDSTRSSSMSNAPESCVYDPTAIQRSKSINKHYTTAHSASQMSDEHRSKVLCLLLHTADISHTGKPWATHQQWTGRITEEFFRQGDWERELALPQSPMCDRDTTPLIESRLGRRPTH